MYSIDLEAVGYKNTNNKCNPLISHKLKYQNRGGSSAPTPLGTPNPTLTYLRHLQKHYRLKFLFATNCEWTVGFEIVSGFKWRFIIIVACLQHL